jgi:hypothetical protein
MSKINDKYMNAQFIDQAIKLGTSVPGITTIEALKNSPFM